MPTESSINRRPIALMLALGAAFLSMVRIAPHDFPFPNLSLMGAIALFCGARLRGAWVYAIPFGLMILSDSILYLRFDYVPFDPFVYAIYLLYIVAGRAWLRNSESPWKMGGSVIVLSSVFFLVTNFGSWVMKAMPYPNTFGGLMESYVAGVSFHRPFLLGDILGVMLLFGTHALLTRCVPSTERVGEVVS